MMATKDGIGAVTKLLMIRSLPGSIKLVKPLLDCFFLLIIKHFRRVVVRKSLWLPFYTISQPVVRNIEFLR